MGLKAERRKLYMAFELDSIDGGVITLVLVVIDELDGEQLGWNCTG
jgi:hypothetical protein